MEKTEAGARKKAPLHDLHQDQVDAGRYRTVRAYVLGCDDLELERDSLEEENEDLRDMLNDIAYRLGLGDEVHYYSGDNYGICQEAVLHAIGCRMMPPGIEWPRFDDGEPVGIGSETDALRVDEIRFGVGDADGCTLYQVGPDGLNDRVQAVAAGERVKRSEPKALDAYGVEIREGDEVWHVLGEFGPRTVARIEVHSGKPYAIFDRDDTDLCGCVCSLLTHEHIDNLSDIANDLAKMAAAWKSYPTLMEAQHNAARQVGEETLGEALDSLTRRARAMARRWQ